MIERCDPDGAVWLGDPDETVEMPAQAMKHARAAIQLHQHTDGRWMWATTCHTGSGGYGYKVGVKWGLFAATRDDALFYGAKEIIERTERRGTDADSKIIIQWARSLT